LSCWQGGKQSFFLQQKVCFATAPQSPGGAEDGKLRECNWAAAKAEWRTINLLPFDAPCEPATGSSMADQHDGFFSQPAPLVLVACSSSCIKRHRAAAFDSRLRVRLHLARKTTRLAAGVKRREARQRGRRCLDIKNRSLTRCRQKAVLGGDGEGGQQCLKVVDATNNGVARIRIPGASLTKRRRKRRKLSPVARTALLSLKKRDRVQPSSFSSVDGWRHSVSY
jgi:hypothetical protein